MVSNTAPPHQRAVEKLNFFVSSRWPSLIWSPTVPNSDGPSGFPLRLRSVHGRKPELMPACGRLRR